MAERRAIWRARMPRLDPRRLVFLDETWVKTNMARLWGRAPRGERLVQAVPHGHWKTTTVLMGLRADGPFSPLVIDGAINGEMFRAWVNQHLCKALRRGEIVVLDNLSAHKISGIKEALEKVGVQLRYLPPYSPDFNPIENLFSKFKWLLRSAAKRTVNTLWKTVGRLLNQFPSNECLRYIRHAGYGKKHTNATSSRTRL